MFIVWLQLEKIQMINLVNKTWNIQTSVLWTQDTSYLCMSVHVAWATMFFVMHEACTPYTMRKACCCCFFFELFITAWIFFCSALIVSVVTHCWAWSGLISLLLLFFSVAEHGLPPCCVPGLAGGRPLSQSPRQLDLDWMWAVPHTQRSAEKGEH